ncbi:glycosyltransferase family 4 protein [Mariniblastus sp.]|nr:glycosyltransferase family 4 protein [Mariniblastus sp.]MDB4757105.1 glycosyltransferase family 4 protein [Mariniblastus sp.]
MRILFFSHYFPPEGNAPATRTVEHCQRWVRAGHDVTVITCAPNVPNGIVYDGFKNRLWPQVESIEGIKVVRVWTWLAPNAGFVKRILNFVSYMVMAVWASLFWSKRPHVIVATSPQFFCGWAGVICSWLRWRPLVLEIRDIWPESILTVGAMKKGVIIRCLEVLERWMYRSAKHIVAVGEGYKQNILSKVPMDERVSVVTNGVDASVFEPREPDAEFIEKWGLTGKFVCSYVGTIGMAHGLDVTIRAAEKLKAMEETNIAFLLVGDGALRKSMQQQVDEKGLNEQIVFTGRLDKEAMPQVLASSSAMLVHLKKSDLFETVIPSKIFEALSMERPIVMGVKGESAEIVRRANAGIFMEPDSEDDLVDSLLKLKTDNRLLNELSSNGREFVSREYSRDVKANAMLDVLLETAGHKN